MGKRRERPLYLIIYYYILQTTREIQLKSPTSPPQAQTLVL